MHFHDNYLPNNSGYQNPFYSIILPLKFFPIGILSSSSSKDTNIMSFQEYLKFLEIPFEDIESATNNFADENILTQGSSFKVYKGHLLQSGDLINIVARKSPQRKLTINELMISKNLKHENIVPVFKIAKTSKSDKTEDELIIINKHEANGSLNKHLGDPTLTSWMQRLHICVGVAHALKYLHYVAPEDNYYVIHGNIKSSKILLDHNWEAKLHGFAFALRAKKNQLHLTSEYYGSSQYMDPAYENTRGLTHKSDVFSFGVLLFEVLFGKEASIQNDDNWYFARLARSHYDDRKLDELIDPDLRKQMYFPSLNKFVVTAYCCLHEQRPQRPEMNQVLSKLETALELQRKHEDPPAVESTSSSNHLKTMLQGKNLNHLKFRLSDIKLATENFSETCCIGSGGYGKVYKAELEHYDGIKSLVDEGMDKGVLPKKRSIVAIKRISSREDGQGKQGFFAEIEMLSKCRHTNIVSLLGFCHEESEMILVYEYVSNGSLDDYLENDDNMTILTWAQRIQICLDIAHGLNYLHTSTEDKKSIIHRDIKSANILLDNKWVAKIADFGLSKLHLACQQRSTLVTNHIAGTELYVDPEYLSTGKLKTKSDVYSFGVVLFEMMCGKLAYDKTYNERGLPSIARQCFKEGTLKNLVDPKINEGDENLSMLIGGVNQDSLDIFINVAYQCLAETQSERPTIEVVIKELTKALNFQKNSKDSLHISPKVIKLATRNFSDCNCIGEGRFWKLYEGEMGHANGFTAIFAKRWDRESPQGHIQFFTELEVLMKYSHKNIIGLVGYCTEEDEKIIVYEHASNGSLDKHLGDLSLTWMKRLKICIDVASGLEFLHAGSVEKGDGMIHRGIKSKSILLDGDWNAKISDLHLSRLEPASDFSEFAEKVDYNSSGYVDPEYQEDAHLTRYSDIYSLGVVLNEILCGRSMWAEECDDYSQSSYVRYYKLENGSIGEMMIFEGITEQIELQSLMLFNFIALQCLHCLEARVEDRLTIRDVVLHLKTALVYQEDYEIWEPKLPIDYNEIIKMSKTPEMYDSIEVKKDLYDMFFKGILLQDDRVLFSLGSNGERNEMISARKFSYKNRKAQRWRHVQESRFHKVAEMFDISKLKIRIKITTQFLSPGVNYGVYIIFKFCDTIKFSHRPMYVNLKYKKGRNNLHAYFARWRDDKWMMIELYRFTNDKKDTNFDVLLESLSRYHCRNSSIYVEGIEFREIDKVKNEEIEQVQLILKSNSNEDQVGDFDEMLKIPENDEEMFFQNLLSKSIAEQLLSLNEVNRKEHLMLSAIEVLYDSSNVKHFHLKPSAMSRFQEVIELLPQHVFRIICKIQSQMLLQDTEYLCYLVFKLSEKCVGLHCPVIVRDLVCRNKNEASIIYFRNPSPWNLHENHSVPEQREDGWMEVKVWEFNSKHQLKNDCISVNLKLITYEGTMSGLIVCGLEFRPM